MAVQWTQRVGSCAVSAAVARPRKGPAAGGDVGHSVHRVPGGAATRRGRSVDAEAAVGVMVGGEAGPGAGGDAGPVAGKVIEYVDVAVAGKMVE